MSKILARRDAELEAIVRQLPTVEHHAGHAEAILGRIRDFFGLETEARSAQPMVR
jgi:hypothetical protein